MTLEGRTAESARRLREARVVPVATIDDPDDAVAVVHALARGGVHCIEITLRTPAGREAIRRASTVEGMLVGAGTVRSPEDARLAAAAGAAFAVAPGTHEPTVATCRELELPFFPGVATVSEIERARALGLDALKLFPAASVGGTAFLRAVAATHPEVRFLPTGGIGPEQLCDYLAIDSVLAVGGSWLTPTALLRARRFDEIERLAREAVELAA